MRASLTVRMIGKVNPIYQYPKLSMKVNTANDCKQPHSYNFHPVISGPIA